MSEPELWTAPGPADDADSIADGWERGRKARLLGLRRVPFGEAVERMHAADPEGPKEYKAMLLRAALGKDAT